MEITNRCRLNCIHCSSEAGSANGQEIPAAALRQLIEDAIPLGLQTFTVSGGDPFLHPGIRDLLTYLRNKDISTCVYTSGVLGSEGNCGPLTDDLIAFLGEQRINKLIFSLHGSNNRIHESITRTPGTPCHAGGNKLLISASGEIFPCEVFKHLKGTRPTIFDWSLEALWYGDELLNILRYYSLQNIENCSACPSLQVCRGGCPGQRMLAYGDILRGPEPLCSVPYMLKCMAYFPGSDFGQEAMLLLLKKVLNQSKSCFLPTGSVEHREYLEKIRVG